MSRKVKCLRCGETYPEKHCTRIAGTEKHICKFCKLRMDIIVSEYKKKPEVTGHWQLVLAVVLIIGGFGIGGVVDDPHGFIKITCLTVAMVLLLIFSFRKKQGEMIYQSLLADRGKEIYTPTFFSDGVEFCLNCGADVEAEDEECRCCGALLDRSQNED